MITGNRGIYICRERERYTNDTHAGGGRKRGMWWGGVKGDGREVGCGEERGEGG